MENLVRSWKSTIVMNVKSAGRAPTKFRSIDPSLEIDVDLSNLTSEVWVAIVESLTSWKEYYGEVIGKSTREMISKAASTDSESISNQIRAARDDLDRIRQEIFENNQELARLKKCLNIISKTI